MVAYIIERIDYETNNTYNSVIIYKNHLSKHVYVVVFRKNVYIQNESWFKSTQMGTGIIEHRVKWLPCTHPTHA